MTETVHRRLRLLAAGLAALALAGPLAAQEEAPSTAVVATHGAWQVRCNDDQSVCVMSQVGKDGSGQDLVEVQIRKLAGAKAPDGTAIPAAIQIVTPLGVLLPPGVRIKIDTKKERAAPYELCSTSGCLVRQPLSAEFLNEMKAGNVARLVMAAPPQQEIATDISLSGFTKAFASLK